MILSVTGPRKILGTADWTYKSKMSVWLYAQTLRKLKELQPTELWAGGALGFDFIASNAAINLNIPLVLCIPFEGHDRDWPDYNKKLHQILLTKASKVNVIGKSFSNNIYQRRNEWMVDMTQHLLACYDGTTPGGTKNCHDYAVKYRKPISYINPKDFSRRTIEGKNKIKNSCRNCDAGTPHRNCL